MNEVEKSDSVAASIKRQFRIGRHRMIPFLEELAVGSSRGQTVYLPPGMLAPELETAWRETACPESVIAELTEIAAASKNGSVLFWGGTASYLVLPPFPLPERAVIPGYAVDKLAGLLKHDFTIAFVLVRLGAYAVALCRGESFLRSKAGTGLVHGRHRKGGSSQQRFQRHREKQTEQFLIRVCHAASQMMEPQETTPDYLVYGGAWTTILALQKRCPFLDKLRLPTLPPLLDIPKPNRNYLETAARQVGMSLVIELQETTGNAGG